MESFLTPLLPLYERERAAGRELALAINLHTAGSTYSKPGALLLIATNGAIQNGVILYGMRVQAAGEVEASICNFSGTTMTPIVNLPVRVVTFG